MQPLFATGNLSSTIFDQGELKKLARIARESGSESPIASARPFLKWAGSKQSLLDHIIQFVPEKFNCYYEPFIGAGSVFLKLQPEKAQISDLSSELIGVWKTIKSSPKKIIEKLDGVSPNREQFYETRANRSLDQTDRASEFIYLNKSCWNGLYRVNSKGQFNVPFGVESATPVIDSGNILRCSEILKKSKAKILCCDFKKATKSASSGDLVFFDPPYVTKHNFNGFRDYNEKLFSWSDQERLANEARRLRKIGARVIVTNAAHADIRDLYRDFSYYEFERPSTLASSATHRGRVNEIIFYG